MSVKHPIISVTGSSGAGTTTVRDTFGNIFKREQIVALIVPGTKSETLAFFLGSNAGLGASIWGTVALVATCPVCAAGAALAAFIFFELAGVTAMADDGDAPEKLEYLAPGHGLSTKFRYVER